MRISTGFRKLIPSILSGAIGISIIIYGVNVDSTGVQLLGLITLIVSIMVMIRTRRKIVCDIKN